jgi:LDH2 family malate/lactate/ureidoglycolate dehydrogenase
MPVVKLKSAEKFCVETLNFYGVSKSHAEIISEVILDSELRGYADHGLSFLKNIIIEFGFINKTMNPTPEIKVIKDDGSTLLLDGDGGCGAIASRIAMDLCIERAQTHGIVAAGIKNSGNIIAPAMFALDAAAQGLFGYCTSNIVGLMAPFGGASRTFGTNPTAYAFPTSNPDVPFLFDMSASTVAAAKVMMAAAAGDEIEEGLIQDYEGNPSVDPFDFLGQPESNPDASELGTILPSGGVKGYGLAMVADILSGVLTGASYGRNLQIDSASTDRPGQFMLVFDIERFLPLFDFQDRLDDQISGIKGGRKKVGVDEILIPGERGLRLKADAKSKGILTISDQTHKSMCELASMTGCKVPVLV